MVPTIEVMEIIISMLMVNLREMKKDHTFFMNSFFNAAPFKKIIFFAPHHDVTTHSHGGEEENEGVCRLLG